jgi:hypothetical protein
MTVVRIRELRELGGVFVPWHYSDTTLGIDCDRQGDRPAADGAIFDVLLVIDTAVDHELNAFAAIRAVDIYRFGSVHPPLY